MSTNCSHKYQALYCDIKVFKSLTTPKNAIVTLAGTGPNGACQVPLLYALGKDFLQHLHSFNIISASVFSFFIFLARQRDELNIQGFVEHESHTRHSHGFPIARLLKNIMLAKPKSNLYDNKLISHAVDNLFSAKFAALTLREIDFPIAIHLYCQNEEAFFAVNKSTHPDMSVRDICHACVSIPWIHGSFNYQQHRFIDPIFSGKFPSLRRYLFSKKQPHLYANHKKNGSSGDLYFIQNESLKRPQKALITDFIKFYLGIKNQRVINTHHEINQLFFN